MTDYYILLKDKDAHKRAKSWNPLAHTYTDDHILKGSLLVALTDSESRDTYSYFPHPLNYKNYLDHSLKLHCEPEDVQQMTDKQFNLLLGVKRSSDRYQLLRTLDWAEGLEIGGGVALNISTIPTPVKGVIKYIGLLPGEDGTKFGVELMERRGMGTTDGTFKHIKYFHCDYDCGVFVSADKLCFDDTGLSQFRSSPQKPAGSDTLKIGDKVILYDDEDQPIRGTVRWIGWSTRVMQSGAKIAGIETKTQRTNPNRVPGAMLGMNHYFTARDHQTVKLFVPVSCVLKEDDASPVAKEYVHPYETRSKARPQNVHDSNQPGNLTNYPLELTTQINDDFINYKRSNPYPSQPGFQSSEDWHKYSHGYISHHQPLSQHMAHIPRASSTDQEVHTHRVSSDELIPILRAGQFDNSLYNPSYHDAYNQQLLERPAVGYSQPYPEPEPNGDYNPLNLEVGSLVEYGNPPISGVIKWIGHIPGMNSLVAGIEMGDVVAGSSDGSWQGTKYFNAQPGKGIFQPVALLKHHTVSQFSNVQPPDTNKVESVKAATLQTPSTSEKEQLTVMNEKLAKSETMYQDLSSKYHQLYIRCQELNSTCQRFDIEQKKCESERHQLYIRCQELDSKCQKGESERQELARKCVGLSNKCSYLETGVIPALLERLDTLEAAMYAVERLWVISRNDIQLSSEILGFGGWGVVKEAIYKGQKVAAKTIHEEIISEHNQGLFLKEIQMMAKCHHKNLVEFIGAVPDEPAIIVIELMQSTLRKALKKGMILVHQIQPVCVDVAQGLRYLHNIRPKSIIHRDVSAANVLLKATEGGGWIAKLSDFGSAQFAHLAQTPGPGAAVYAAPEVTGPPRQQTVKIDVYSYGVLLVEILTKKIPTGSIVGDLRSLEAQWPQYVIISRSCVNVDPDRRPAMTKILTDLNEIKI